MVGSGRTTPPKPPSRRFAPKPVRLLARLERGPLLNIPDPGSPGSILPKRHQTLYMVQSTDHWLPIVNGHTRFMPEWHKALRRLTAEPPHPKNLRTLVERTGIRWILEHGEAISKVKYERWKTLGQKKVLLRILSEDANLTVFGTPLGPPTVQRLERDIEPGGHILVVLPAEAPSEQGSYALAPPSSARGCGTSLGEGHGRSRGSETRRLSPHPGQHGSRPALRIKPRHATHHSRGRPRGCRAVRKRHRDRRRRHPAQLFRARGRRRPRRPGLHRRRDRARRPGRDLGAEHP